MSKGIITSPYKTFWLFASQIEDTLESFRTRAETSDVDTNLLPYDSSSNGNGRDSTASQLAHIIVEVQKSDRTEAVLNIFSHRVERRAFSISDEFEKLKAKAKATAVLADLQYVLDFTNAQLQSARIEYQDLAAQEAPETKYRDLWKFYFPGTTILSKEQGCYQAYSIFHATGGQPVLDPNTSQQDEPVGSDFTALHLDCYSIDFDGQRYQTVMKSFDFESFTGKRSVMSHTAYPLAYADSSIAPNHPNRGDKVFMRDVLEARGEKFRGLVRDIKNPKIIPHKLYEGLTLDVSPREVDCPVIVDLEQAAKANLREISGLGFASLTIPDPAPSERSWAFKLEGCDTKGCTDPACQSRKKHYLGDDNSDYCLTEDVMLLPYKVEGFVLRPRKWAFVNVDLIQDLKKQLTDPFDHLVLPEGHKTVLGQLVLHHLSKKENAARPENCLARNMDPINGKGNGLIILLHGEPGVGKTSTAEAMTPKSGLPLYPITCGDLGQDAEDVEHQLYDTFQKAQHWNCILLLDEADIFLAPRSKNDGPQRALGVLDDAFKSRIRLSLYYPPLNVNQTRRIFEEHVNMITQRAEKAIVDREDIIDFAQNEFDRQKKSIPSNYGLFEGWWNGRQIRNAFQTATVLASVDQKGKQIKPFHLTVDHFREVAKTTDEFDEYMKKTHRGISDSQRAIESLERALHTVSGMNSSGWSAHGVGFLGQPQRTPASIARKENEYDHWGDSDQILSDNNQTSQRNIAARARSPRPMPSRRPQADDATEQDQFQMPDFAAMTPAQKKKMMRAFMTAQQAE